MMADRDDAPEVDVRAPNAVEQIRDALAAIKIDIVVNQDGILVATTPNGRWRTLTEDKPADLVGLAFRLKLLNAGRRDALPIRLAKKFVRRALAEHWYPYGYRDVSKPWKQLFPDGRYIFYEGDDPERFVEQIRNEFGFDPSADPDWNNPDYQFLCPAEHLDAIYGNDRFPMGS